MQSGIAEHFDNMPGEILLDVSVARNRLGHTSVRIPIPVMLAPMPNQYAAQFFQGFD
jgi:hypothetical protein